MMFLSLRHLLSRKKQSFFILLGIIIGTGAYVVISGMMFGFRLKFLDQLVNNDSHIRVSAREELLNAEGMDSFPKAAHVFWSIPPSGRKDSAKIEYPVGWFERLDRDPDVVAYSPQVNLNVIFNRAKVNIAGRLIGMQYQRQEKVSNIAQNMVTGKFSDVGNAGNRLIIGRALMENMGARVSETVLVSSGQGRPQPFKIVGVFETGIHQIDEITAYGALADTQKLRGAPSEITDIAIRISDAYAAEIKAEEWKFGVREKVLSWLEASASLFSVFKTQDIVRNAMTISIIVVAGFGIYNILSIMVAQKRRDIAILRSMGFTPRDVVQLFFNQGLILGIIGGLIGLVLGFVICLMVEQIEVLPGRFMMGANHMIVSYDPAIYGKGLLISILSSIFSSIWPAREAGKLDPIEIIRSGGQ